MVKKEKSLLEKIGPWAFILGLIISIVSALTGKLFWGLGLLGLVVGLLNITDKEASMYLLASLTFLLSANTLSVTLTKVVSFIPVVGEWLKIIDPLLANITLFVAPGAAVVALKALYNLSRD
ncbi:MAG: hypothetical protein QXM96_03535 [Candidatus Woesearchaeota archaeon]